MILSTWRDGEARPQELPDHGSQVKTVVESIGGLGQIPSPVLVDVDGVVSAAEGRLEVADQGGGPTEHVQIT